MELQSQAEQRVKLIEDWKSKYHSEADDGEAKRQTDHFKKLYYEIEEDNLRLGRENSELTGRVEKSEREMNSK